MDGTTVSVKLTDKTEYRKDRQSAKLADFKVGEMVFVRGEENADHSVTAQVIGGRSGNGPGAGRGFVGGAGFELGKDYVLGEVKSVDAPKLTVLRPDNVTQTLELNEDTSLRRGRESITMADIQPGDHVMVRGAVEKNVFVPKNLMLFSPEQWKARNCAKKQSAATISDSGRPTLEVHCPRHFLIHCSRNSFRAVVACAGCSSAFACANSTVRDGSRRCAGL